MVLIERPFELLQLALQELGRPLGVRKLILAGQGFQLGADMHDPQSTIGAGRTLETVGNVSHVHGIAAGEGLPDPPDQERHILQEDSAEFRQRLGVVAELIEKAAAIQDGNGRVWSE
jgi:hypothetical protein